jgi:hypothetical protein
MRARLDPLLNIFLGVPLRGLVGHSPVPQVELTVVSEHLERLTLHPPEVLRLSYSCFS